MELGMEIVNFFWLICHFGQQQSIQIQLEGDVFEVLMGMTYSNQYSADH